MGVRWKHAGENLVQRQCGTIYLRAKVGGKIKRLSLETKNLRIAKIKRDDKLETLRAAARKASFKGAVTLGQILERVSQKQLEGELKPSTVVYYGEISAILRATLPIDLRGQEWRRADAVKWWKDIKGKYAPQRANNALALAKRVGAALVEAGQQLDDPTADLKRVRIPKRDFLNIPAREALEQVVASIAAQAKRSSKHAALYVSFLAYSGCRHAEAAACEWSHVGSDWLTITGGAKGTKNHDFRRIPISEPLRQVLEALRPPDADGPLFYLKSPHIALQNACKRLNLPHLRLHDLRHFFATWCIESGIDIPTVSGWLGHKDGGVLAMSVYGHRRDDHSLKEIQKLGS